LTGIHASNFAAWSSTRAISEKNLKIIAQSLGIDKSEALKGLELRRRDVAIAREVQAKFEKLIAQQQPTVQKGKAA
jgi:hypothetical protein